MVRRTLPAFSIPTHPHLYVCPHVRIHLESDKIDCVVLPSHNCLLPPLIFVLIFMPSRRGRKSAPPGPSAPAVNALHSFTVSQNRKSSRPTVGALTAMLPSCLLFSSLASSPSSSALSHGPTIKNTAVACFTTWHPPFSYCCVYSDPNGLSLALSQPYFATVYGLFAPSPPAPVFPGTLVS